jgi:hypothetical protein
MSYRGQKNTFEISGGPHVIFSSVQLSFVFKLNPILRLLPYIIIIIIIYLKL